MWVGIEPKMQNKKIKEILLNIFTGFPIKYYNWTDNNDPLNDENPYESEGMHYYFFHRNDKNAFHTTLSFLVSIVDYDNIYCFVAQHISFLYEISTYVFVPPVTERKLIIFNNGIPYNGYLDEKNENVIVYDKTTIQVDLDLIFNSNKVKVSNDFVILLYQSITEEQLKNDFLDEIMLKKLVYMSPSLCDELSFENKVFLKKIIKTLGVIGDLQVYKKLIELGNTIFNPLSSIKKEIGLATNNIKDRIGFEDGMLSDSQINTSGSLSVSSNKKGSISFKKKK